MNKTGGHFLHVCCLHLTDYFRANPEIAEKVREAAVRCNRDGFTFSDVSPVIYPVQSTMGELKIKYTKEKRNILLENLVFKTKLKNGSPDWQAINLFAKKGCVLPEDHQYYELGTKVLIQNLR